MIEWGTEGRGLKATEAEIRRKYHKLSLCYHPDRHVRSVEEQKFAHKKFPSIEFAKRVLLDSHLREIYDEYGYRGVLLFLESSQGGNRADTISLLRKVQSHSERSAFGRFYMPLSFRNPQQTPVIDQVLVTQGVQVCTLLP
jgi:DnaJ-class molecular chaperone